MRWSAALILVLLTGFAGELQAQITYSVKPVGFNTREFDEYAPVFYGNGLVFSSNRKNAVFLDYSDLNNTPLLDMYYAELKRKNRFGLPELLSRNLTTIYHDGPASFSPDASQIVFTRNIETEKKFGNDIDPNNRLGLFFADRVGEEWENVQPFEHNGTQYNTGHACFSPNNQRVYFISDRPGGAGGTDLYYCDRNGTGWSQPVNLGNRANSEGNEMFPYVHPNGVLYFAANRPEGMGGLDIYFTQEVNGIWMTPQGLPAPINSASDDFGFVADEHNLTGYFSSHRRGSDDIFRFEATYPGFDRCDSMLANNYCFTFYETNSMPLDSMPLKYEWDMGDGQSYRGLEVNHCFDGPGHYPVALNIVDTLSGETFFNEATYDFYIEDAVQPVITAPDSSTPNLPIRFEAVKTHLPTMVIEHYYWDFGDGAKGIGPVVNHAYAKEGNYSVALGIHSKADSSGQVRAACTYRNLVITDQLPTATSAVLYAAAPPEMQRQAVIRTDPRQRLDALFASKDLDPGVPLSPEFTSATGLPLIDKNSSQLNELGSVEFINPVMHYLVEYHLLLEVAYSVEVASSDTAMQLSDAHFDPLKPDYEITEREMGTNNLLSYTVGEGEKLFDVYPVFADVKQRGYADAVVRMHVLDTEKLSEEQVADVLREKLSANTPAGQLFPGVGPKVAPAGYSPAGKVFACFFEKGTYHLKAESLADLDRLANALKANPGLMVDIAGHTDNTGTPQSNMMLARNRALTLREYFLQRHITASRISYNWYGQAKPLGNNETIAGKELNRRVEVRILAQGE